MERNREHWMDSDNPTRIAWGFGRWFIVILAVFAVIGGVAWGVKVATSPVQGRGDAYRQQQSAPNRIFAQAYFQDTYNQVQATATKIALAEKVKTPTDEQTTRLDGLRAYCADLVGEYNAKSDSYLTQDFKDAELPTRLTANDCQGA